MKINLNPNQNPASDADREAKIAAGGFGKYYTDNMLVAQWSEASGWSDAEIKAYGPLSIDPASCPFNRNVPWGAFGLGKTCTC